MTSQENVDFVRIAKAIEYIREDFKHQPDLDAIAQKVNLSPYHFQRLFTEWAGVSPKKFLQYISVEYAKRLLKNDAQPSLFDVAHKTGLSSTGRLHDLFVSLEGMTPGDYKNGGEHLAINYSFAQTPFGEMMIASTMKGVCYMAFTEDRTIALRTLKAKFPNAAYHEITDHLQQNALSIFSKDWSNLPAIKLHLKGTEFQLRVWEALLKIPLGGLTTYGDIAQELNAPNASRAVGTAVGDNPIAFLIPCHRVIRSSGELGGYHWGLTRKTALIGWEAARINEG